MPLNPWYSFVPNAEDHPLEGAAAGDGELWIQQHNGNTSALLTHTSLLHNYRSVHQSSFRVNFSVQTTSNAALKQCLRNYIGTLNFADVSDLMANVEAKFFL